MKSVDTVKLNQTKTSNEMKRAILGDIASNRMHSSVLGLSNPSAPMYKSRLPVLKAGFVDDFFWLDRTGKYDYVDLVNVIVFLVNILMLYFQGKDEIICD